MKRILIIIFQVITSFGFLFSIIKWSIVSTRYPAIYEVTSSDGTKYTVKKDSFKRNSNKYKDSVRFELEDGSTVVLTNDYSYKLLDLNPDELERWKKEYLLYSFILIGSAVAWVSALFFESFFDM